MFGRAQARAPWVGALLILVVSAGWALAGPFSFIHPDEQSALYQARIVLGTQPILPEDLQEHARAFRPFNSTFFYHDDTPLRTGYGATSGIGFAYPLFLAPFVLVSDEFAYLSGPVSLAILYLGAALFLGWNRPTTPWLAALVIATPSILLHAGLLYTNLPGLAFFVLGMGLVAAGLRTRWPPALTLGLLAVLAAVALRRDFLASAGLFVLLAPALFWMRMRRVTPVVLGWLGFAGIGLVLLASLFYWSHGVVGLPYFHFADTNPEADDISAWNLLEALGREAEGRQARTTTEVARQTNENYLFAFVPVLLTLGALTGLFPGRLAPSLVLVLPLGIHGILVWALTAGGHYHGLHCVCVDETHARYFMPIYASLSLLAAIFLDRAISRIRHAPLAVPIAAGFSILILGASLGHAFHGEQGITWVIDTREAQNSHEEVARALPEDAVIVGEFLAKIVYSRPVLVPAYARENLAPIIDDLHEKGRPVYVHKYWAVRDESFSYGEYFLSSGKYYFAPTPHLNYVELRASNATLVNVYSLPGHEWTESPADSSLRLAGSRANLTPSSSDGRPLPHGDWTVANGTISITYLETSPGQVFRVGFGRGPSGDANVLAQWNATDTGSWKTAAVHISGGVLIQGSLWLEGFTAVSAIRVEWEERP